MASWARWVIRAVVSAGVIAILLVLIPLDAVGDALTRVSAWTWIASVAIFFAGHYLNAIKLRLLTGHGGSDHRRQGSGGPPKLHAKADPPSEIPAPISTFVRAQYAGLVANLGLPGLATGDVARAVYLARSVGVARITAASIADRIIDTLTMVVFITVALLFAGLPPALAGVVGHTGLWVGGAVIAGVAGVFVLKALLRHPAIASKLGGLRDAFSAPPSAVASAMAISCAVQAAFVMTNVWLARQVGVTTAVAAWFVAWPLAKLIAVLPLSLGGIGVREAALVSLLAPYGASADATLASGILWQSVLMVTGLVGLVVTQLLPQAPGAQPAAKSI